LGSYKKEARKETLFKIWATIKHIMAQL
jgi:hypothetical protein